MATNKRNQMSTINKKDIKEALEAFKSAYKEDKKQHKEENVKIEDVVNLTKVFSGKSTSLVLIAIISVMIAMPSREFIVLMNIAKSISKAKFLEVMKEILKEKVKKDANNDIYN